MSPAAKKAEMAVVLALSPLIDKYGREPVGEVLVQLGGTLLGEGKEEARTTTRGQRTTKERA